MSNRRSGRTNAQLIAAGLKECELCGVCWTITGFTRHYKSCKSRLDGRRRALERQIAPDRRPDPTVSCENQQLQHQTSVFSQEVPNLLDLGTSCVLQTYLPVNQAISEVDKTNHETITLGSPNSPRNLEQPNRWLDHSEGSWSTQTQQSSPSPKEGDIKILRHSHPDRCKNWLENSILHTRSQAPPAFLFGRVAPWAPFQSRADFRFARAALKANLSGGAVNEFLAIHHLTPASSVSIKNNRELQQLQDQAASQLSMFEPRSFTVAYNKGRDRLHAEHVVLIKSLKEWLLELVLNPLLQPYLHFDAEQKYRFSGDKWVRFIDEPWSADNWAKTQASLPSNGLPLNIQLYTDKALASGSGAKKLYPMIARLANLPQDIRNGQGVGSGQVVALLPVITDQDLPEGLAESAVADYKCAVWHGAVQKLLDTIRLEAFAGHAVELECHHALGLEKALWRLFPAISIVSADLEEQSTIVCHRGGQCLFPCVRCLIPDSQLHNLLFVAQLREPKIFLDNLAQAQSLGITAARNILKAQGYRPVPNALMSLGPRTNVFQALSYDTLHCDDLGRWGRHIWTLLQERLNAESRQVQSKFNTCINSVPSWPELNHFCHAQSVSFTDGTKYEDLLRVVLHGCLELPESFSALVQLVRVQAELRVLASLDIHTEETIALGRFMVKKLHHISLECTVRYGKSFNFPKMHLAAHLFDDIINKGVSANFSTKPGEHMHSGLRDIYKITSKRSSTVDQEILRKHHMAVVFDYMQQNIDAYDAEIAAHNLEDEESAAINEVYHVQLGSRSKQLVLGLIEEQHPGDAAFHHLDSRVHRVIAQLDPTFLLDSAIKVHVCNMLTVQYKSLVDWRLHCETLRCSPNIYSKERRDCVLVHSNQGIFPARLLMLIACINPVTKAHLPLALVAYFDSVHGPISVLEQAIGFRRFRQRSRESAEIISVKSIIRGVLMVPTMESDELRKNDFLANDLVDSEMFIRFKHYSENNMSH